MWQWLRKADERLMNVLCVALAIGMTVLVFAEIFSKAVFAVSIRWSTDVVVYMLLWIIFLGGALCCRDNEQISIQILVDRLPARARMIVIVLQKVITIIVLGIIAYSMSLMLEILRTAVVPTVRVSQAVFMFPCAVFIVLYAIYETAGLVRLLKGDAK